MKPRYLSLAGQERPLYFGFNALWKVEKATGVPFARIADLFIDLTFETLLIMLEAALQDGARREGLDYTLTREELADALDDYGMDRFDEIITALTSFMIKDTGEGVQEASGEEAPM
jgi:hypothetical protein